MDYKNLDLLEIIKTENIDTAELIRLLFIRYEIKKKENTLYSKDDYIPQNLIKIYYKSESHLTFKEIVDNFKKKYICNENKIENVHDELEMKGLEVVYDYIQSEDTEKFKNIYIINLLHMKLYSQVPYKGYGGTYRNAHAMITNSDVTTSAPEAISYDIANLYNEYQELLTLGDNINQTKDMDQLINYINQCLVLKTKIIKIHPFSDGNGRVSRALLNILFKRVNLPPTYVKKSEYKEYITAMDKAIRLNDLSSIEKFYYYKICDSIIELDTNNRKNKKEYTGAIKK